MSDTQDVVIKLLRIVLTGKVCHLPDNVRWEEVMTLASDQGVMAIAFDTIEKLSTDQRPDIDTLMEWLGQTNYIEEQNKQNWLTACTLVEKWKQKDIRTIVLKGFSLCQYYPNPMHRFSGDLDVFLSDYENGNKVTEGLGIKVDRGQYKHSKFEYKGLSVENHRFCISLRGDKRAKRMEAFLEELLNNEDLEPINDSQLFCPPPLFNMLFVTVHNLNHFLHEKITLRHIYDWIILRRAYKNLEDWSRYNRLVKEYGLDVFAKSMDALADYVCGNISYDDLSRKDRLLLDDIFSSEIEGNFDTSMSSRIRGMKNIWASRWKYSEFTDKSALRHLVTVTYGFLFDRNPKIKN